jgi:hypothetical protein
VCYAVLVKKGKFVIVKNAERKRAPLLANLGDFNRPVRVRPVRYMSREWWAIASEDTWPGMVMDLRRLGFEAVALEEEVLVREGIPAYEPQMEGPAALSGLKPFPTIHPTISIQRDSYRPMYPSLDEYDVEDSDLDEDDVDDEEHKHHQLETEDLDAVG